MDCFKHNGVKFKITWIAESWLVTNLNDLILADNKDRQVAISQACKVYDLASTKLCGYLEARRQLGY